MSLYSRPTTNSYGFTSLPADQAKTPPSTTSPQPVPLSTLQPPTTPLASRIHAHAKHHLPPATYLHSLRVFSYGVAISSQCYPSYNLSTTPSLLETWFLTAMLHDIGTTPTNLTATRLSYEFFAGHLALDILQHRSATASTPDCDNQNFGSDSEAPVEQAESVAEAIIRHQDVQPHGNLTLMTRLIHWGTLLDNIGAGAELVHPETVRVVNEGYDRKGWCGCFKETVEREKAEKPYAMVSRIEGFEEKIEQNGREGVMAKWDQGTS